MKITKKQLYHLVENEVRKQLINNNKINEKWLEDNDTTFAEDFMNILEPYRQEYLQQYKWELDTDTVDAVTFMKYILGCTKGRYSHKYNTDIYKIQQILDNVDTNETVGCSVRLRNTIPNEKYLDRIANKYHLYSEVSVKERYFDDDSVEQISDKFVLIYSYFIPITKVLEILPDLLNDLATSSDLTYL